MVFWVTTIFSAAILWAIAFYIVHGYLTKLTFSNNIQWDNYLTQKYFFKIISCFVPIVFIYIIVQFYPSHSTPTYKKALEILTIITLGVSSISALASFGAYYEDIKNSIDIPTDGYVNVLSSFVIIASIISIVCIIYDISFWKVLSGLGAASAMLVFALKDTFIAFNANLQLLGQEMAGKNDWVEVSKFSADGIVEDISLYFISIRNWDNSLVQIPISEFVNSSFKNWQKVDKNRPRRMLRSINIDIDTIRELSEKEVKTLIDSGFIAKKPSSFINLDIFQKYMLKSLMQHDKISNKNANENTNAVIHVRQLQPTSQGLPLQIYAYSIYTDWIKHDNIQDEIISKFLADMKAFHLSSFQQISSKNIVQISQV